MQAIGWTGSVKIIDKLVPPGEERYLRTVENTGGGNPRIRFSSSATEDPTLEGDDLTSAWETYEAAITIIASDGEEVVLKGPANTDNSFSDSTEIYFWTPDNSTEFSAFITAHVSETVTFYFDDGQVESSEVGVEIEIGNPSVSTGNPVSLVVRIGNLPRAIPQFGISHLNVPGSNRQPINGQPDRIRISHR